MQIKKYPDKVSRLYPLGKRWLSLEHFDLIHIF